MSDRSYTVTLTVTEYDALKARIEKLERAIEESQFAMACGGPLALVISRVTTVLEDTASETMAKQDHVEGCRCPECDPDYNDPRNTVKHED